jgi:hypothetical protein
LVALLTCITFNLYFVYWAFMTWREIKSERDDSRMRPFWHALAFVVPLYSLVVAYQHARAIRDLAPHRGSRLRMRPWLWTAALLAADLLLIVLLLAPTSYLELILGSMVPMVVMIAWGQLALNAAWQGLPGGYRKATIHPLQWLGILVLGMFTMLVLFAAAFLEGTQRATSRQNQAVVTQLSKLEEIDRLRRQADGFALQGDSLRARTTFEQAVTLAADAGSASTDNELCWYGSIDNLADVVLPACDRAVAEAPGYPPYGDSRGVARALLGDYPGAIDDFSAFVEWSRTAGSRYDSLRPKREAWIETLKTGRNPLDAQALIALRTE